MYSPRNGIIAAIDTKKAAVETLFWSDAAFAMWEAAAAFGQRDIKDLRYIAHHSISNIFAQAVINRMIGGRPGEVKIFGQHTEAFLALLGTVNGAGSVHLLMQHKRQLGRKTIVEAIVFGRVQRDWHWKGPDVIFELKELPSPEMGDTAATNATSSSELTGLCRSLNSLGLDVLEEI